MQDIVVFFFAHQDDEFAVFFAIEEAVREGVKVICLYLTDGGYGGQSTLRRNDESRNVLRRLGVNEVDIDFIGTREGYRDGHLYTHLEDVLRSVEATLDPICNIRALYIPAWEGGHRDHDAVHLVGAAFAVKAGLVDVARQFPLYRAARNVIGFALFKPLVENGPIQAETIPLPKRLRFLRLSFCYPSQWMYWAGLFPCLVYSYCSKGTQETQGLSIARVVAPPHTGTLLYERYGDVSHAEFRAVTEPFIQARILRRADKFIDA
jgi:hypothetical protein